MAADDTKKRVLDAAEELFALRGHSAVTFREISEKAGLHTSQIVYHFRNKGNLLESVVVRRANTLNADRMSRLQAYHSLYSEGHADPEPLIRAFMEPYLSRLAAGDMRWQYYGSIIGRIVWDPATSPIMERAYNKVADAYIQTMCQAIPHASQESIHRGFHFMLALVFSVGADDHRLQTLSGGRFSLKDYDRTHLHSIPFLVQGFQSLAEIEGNAKATRSTAA